jgi:hypothetical protein
MHHSALTVLHVAADTIRQCDGVIESTAENDHKSGEIIFTTITGETYRLKLTRIEDEAEESATKRSPGGALYAADTAILT